MNSSLLKELIDMVDAFEKSPQRDRYSYDFKGFTEWLKEKNNPEPLTVDWESREKGRSAESAISTFLVHMGRYGKLYSKAAIQGSDFTSQEDFIFLITLKAFGPLSKAELIRKNVIEKNTGIQVINRLLAKGWVTQHDSETDKRSKRIAMTPQGLKLLEEQMPKIRQATKIVSGNLTQTEKEELISLLNKLEEFHNPIYCHHSSDEGLLEKVLNEYPFLQQ